MKQQFSEIMSIVQEPDIKKIVVVGCVSGGFILTGKRRDNGKWTNPGGHVDEGEELLTAAQREVREEAGIEIDWQQIEFIGAERVPMGRGGYPFVVIAFLAHIDRLKATAKNDPDKEISEWKWVPLELQTPELQPEARHAQVDAILVHLGMNKPKEARLRRMSDVSKDLQGANFEKDPPAPASAQEKQKAVQPGEQTPTLPDPKVKTPEEMAQNPDAYLEDHQVVGE